MPKDKLDIYDKLLDIETLSQYWTPIDIGKLLNEFIPLNTEV